MDDAEARALESAVDLLVRTYDERHRFIASDICRFHRTWLGEIYDWAGDYRKVNVSRDGFPFAAAAQIPKLMQEYERGTLRRCTPCNFETREQVIRALAEAHAELVLIHPFREGNGRTQLQYLKLLSDRAGHPIDLAKIGALRWVEASLASHAADYSLVARLIEEAMIST